MSMYAFKDKDKEEKLYAKDATAESRERRFYCPNPSCDAHMYICGLDGTAAAYFSANRKGHKHIEGCSFEAENGFNPDKNDENEFDFDSAMDSLAIPSKAAKKSVPGEHGMGTPTDKPLRTIRQIYDMCKSIDVVDTYNGKEIGQMIIDGRSEFMYPRGVFGKRIIEGKAFGYFYDSKKLEITIGVPINTRTYSFILKFDDNVLFATIQKTIYNNKSKIVVVSGNWESAGAYNVFCSNIVSKKQVTIIKR